MNYPALMEVMEIKVQQTGELKTERFVFMMEKSTLEAIDEWSFKNRVRTRAEVIRQLIQIGLEASKVETKKADAAA
jgi:metal-responsive CopG/Arc/MetJ family transcriptional regulator